MQFLQAKHKNNKLNIRNNLPYAIDNITIEENGILVNLTSFNGITMYVRYSDVMELKKDFDVINAFDKIKEYKEY